MFTRINFLPLRTHVLKPKLILQSDFFTSLSFLLYQLRRSKAKDHRDFVVGRSLLPFTPRATGVVLFSLSTLSSSRYTQSYKNAGHPSNYTCVLLSQLLILTKKFIVHLVQIVSLHTRTHTVFYIHLSN